MYVLLSMLIVYDGKLIWHLNKLKSLKVAKLKDEGCDEVSGEGSEKGVEGGMKV